MIPGIDAGGHRIKMAVHDSTGHPVPITNRYGEPFIRSVVFFAEDGSIIIGTEAENAGLADPKRAVSDWKRHIGTKKVLHKAEDGKVCRAKETLGLLLTEAKETIETKTGEVCEEAVITIPAVYTDVQKQETQDAGSEAGLKILCMPKEPTAAALGNDFHKHKDSKALIFDMGGSTFDVSILENKGNSCEVLATNGDPKLGAMDFNACLKEIILEQYERAHGYRPKPKDDSVFYHDLSQRAEQAKLTLTVRPQTEVVLSCNGDTLKVTVTRAEFNKRILPLVEKAMRITEKTVKDTNLDLNDIREVYAVGGGSLVPIVQEELEKLTGKKVSRRCEPHSAAALGAVIAGRLEYARLGKDYRVRGGTLPPPAFYVREILSRPIGVAVLDETEKELCSEILAKKTPIPSVQTRTFKMTEPSQTEVLIRVLDGEDGIEANKCVELGHFEMKALPPRPDLIGRIEITFNLDRNGMLTAAAHDTVSGKSAELKMAYKNKADTA
ncbi:MAG: Hsp70 family protein [Planctomycetota bacterium]|jgi:molecular chaperone DnaK